ncbi:MAG: hypothetical protein RRC07_07670 [Anaerolineae bacterium]|nr:hypothetical protein [Anaerolineae bacterium]
MQQQFLGLTMPVFTAFGWAGEEAALNFALSQLEAFIHELHANLSRSVQNYLPYAGLNRDVQTVFLATSEQIEDDVFIAFFVRPMSLEIQLGITDAKALSRTLKSAEAAPQRFRELLEALGPGWSLYIKQMEVDEESDKRTSYQDLFKDDVSALDDEAMTALVSRASFLNGESKWATPLYISRRFPSEQIAAMGRSVVPVMAEQIDALQPLLEFLMGKTPAKKDKEQEVAKSKAATRLAEATDEALEADQQFVFETVLKPLHIRRGFINLTSHHWDFFAESARATTRDVIVSYEDKVDRESAVWRLASNDMARIVLGEAARAWLERTFFPDERIQLVATKRDDDEIEIVLGPAP